MTLPIDRIIEIGYIDQKVIDLLGLSITHGTPILLGPLNIQHMIDRHPEDYNQYFGELQNILANPTHVIPNPKDGSLQYIKMLDNFVLAAVRVSGKGNMFSKSLYQMGPEKIEGFCKRGLFNKYKLF